MREEEGCSLTTSDSPFPPPINKSLHTAETEGIVGLLSKFRRITYQLGLGFALRCAEGL